MKRARLASAALLFIGLAAGTLADRPRTQPPLFLAGYRVLAVDFHVHAFPASASTLAPWIAIAPKPAARGSTPSPSPATIRP